MRRRAITLVGLACLALNCRHKQSDPHRPRVNFSTPYFRVLDLQVDLKPKRDSRWSDPKAEDFENRINQASRAWTREWCEKFQGAYGEQDGICRNAIMKPAELPQGNQDVAIWLRDTDATSADGNWTGHGRFGMWIKAWSYTHNRPRTFDEMVPAAAHFVSHKIGDCGSAHNAVCDARIAGICGC